MLPFSGLFLALASGVLSNTGGLVGVAGAAAGVEFVLALGVGGGQSESGKGHSEEGGDADHFGGVVEGREDDCLMLFLTRIYSPFIPSITYRYPKIRNAAVN